MFGQVVDDIDTVTLLRNPTMLAASKDRLSFVKKPRTLLWNFAESERIKAKPS